MTGSHEGTWMHRVWRGWRREIIRGALLFAVVAGVGLFIIAQVRAFEPLALLRDGGLSAVLADHDRKWVDAYRWAGQLERGQQVWVRNLSGAIVIERADGDSVIVTAEKSWRHGDPESVEIMAVPSDGSVTFCALWAARVAECGPRGTYEVKGGKGSDVAVRFVVRLPEGIAADASTVNGKLTAENVRSSLTLGTVNGSVDVTGATGDVTAETVNGSIVVVAGQRVAPLDLQTVNGSIRVYVPTDIGAELEASTVNGRVTSDLPLQIVGRVNPRKLSATIGGGGTPLRFKTVNGSVTLATLESAPKPTVAEAPPVPGVPEAPRAPRRAPRPPRDGPSIP